jgi:hypothetical protein
MQEEIKGALNPLTVYTKIERMEKFKEPYGLLEKR